ncbi:MAG: CHAD domain-containing protein [Chitinophagia bacterium]|nr:CHAD domain-containing protein [Chitinophagia bacterium]
MKGQKLRVYFSQNLQYLFNIWVETIQEGSVSNLHDLRVQLKRMKAVYSFLQWVYGKSSLGKVPHLTRDIFQQTGEWRELQILQIWLTKEKIQLHEQLHCSDEDVNQIGKTVKLTLQKRYSLYTKQIKKVEQLVEKTHPVLIDQYWLQLSNSLKKETKKSKLKDWHELRKTCKKWLYTINWLGKDWIPEQKTVKEFHQLEKNIGDWNECLMILQRLEDVENMDKASLEIRQQYAMAIANIRKKMNTMEKKTRQQLKKITS